MPSHSLSWKTSFAVRSLPGLSFQAIKEVTSNARTAGASLYPLLIYDCSDTIVVSLILSPSLLLRLRQMRCPEIDFRSTWKWALPVLDLVESSQDLPTLTSDNDRENDSGPSGSGPSRLRLIKDGLKGSAKETYLKRMLVAAHQWQVGRDWFAM